MSKYAVDPALSALPTIKFTHNTFRLRMLSGLLRLTRLFYRWGSEIELRRHRVNTAQGNTVSMLELRPTNATAITPALMYYHGGAFFLSYGRGHLDAIKRYALRANCSVFLVEYRLSTQRAFPAAFDDCCNALQWVYQQATALKIDENRIAVAGDSAGGCLAAVVAQKANDQLHAGQSNLSLVGQLLIYPVIDHRATTASAQQFTDTPVWTSESNRVMWDIYLRDQASLKDSNRLPAYAAPALHQGLAGLPDTYIETAEFDPLRDEGDHYADALKRAEVAVQHEQVAGAVHGYDMINCALTRCYNEKRVAALQEFFSR